MDLGLEGKAAIVTGASRGIGRAIALTFAAEGCDLAICARGGAALAEAAEEIRARGAAVHAQVCDVSDAAALDAFLDGARAALGRIDILINNASAIDMGSDDSAWRTNFEVDVLAPVRASERVVPWLRERGGGAIVHLSSTAALEAPTPPPYSALKAALISFSKNQAVALAPENIRVNTVAPGCIDFPGGMWDEIHRRDPGTYDEMVATIPGGRMGTDQEIADVVAFVASERARWLRGALISVDGGQHKANL
ncbi:MAG: SDR family oxidoreductase [Proteobacteria bacterium]|nr:SDR family oxidoreductase [Pseudomonadota bacterium]